MEWVVIVILVILAILAIKFWYIAVPLGIVGFIIYKIHEANEQRRQAEEAERNRRRQAEEAERDRLAYLDSECRSLACLRESSHVKFHSLNQIVSSASGWLDTAEQEFKERAFAPFWDALEHATNFLGEYHESIEEIKTTASYYEDRRSLLTVTVPAFDVPEAGMPDARPLASRLSNLGRAAQKDFQFATIYEQRKTNQLLYSGFGTLATGLQCVQHAITDALNDLSVSLGTRLDDLLAVSTSHAEAFNNYSQAAATHFETAASHYKTSEDELKKQSDMLDNI